MREQVWGHGDMCVRSPATHVRYEFSANMSMEEGEMALEPGWVEAMRRKTFVAPRRRTVREELRR